MADGDHIAPRLRHLLAFPNPFQPLWGIEGLATHLEGDAERGTGRGQGFRRGSGVAKRYWYGEDGERWWTRWTAGVETLWTEDHSGNPLQRQVIPFTWLNGPRQSFLFFAVGLGSPWFEGQEIDRNFVELTGEVQTRPWAELYRFPVRRHSSDLFNQLLFSYKLNPQTVLFLGYADNHFAEERTVDALFQTDRTLFFKVGYALAL